MIILWAILILILVKLAIDPKLDITDTQIILWFNNLEGERQYMILLKK